MSSQLSHLKLKNLTPQALEQSGWVELFDAQPDPRFYQHPDWYLAANRSLLDQSLQIAVVLREQMPVALIPWQSRTAGKRYRAPEHDHLTLGDILLHPDLSPSQQQQVLAEVLQAAGDKHWDWQLVNLPDRSRLATAIADDSSWSWRESRRSAWFDLRSDALAPAGKLKRNLKRLRTKLEAQGALREQWIDEPALLEEAFGQFLSLEASSWKGTRQQSTAIAHKLELQAFYQQLLRPVFPGLKPVVTLLWLDNDCIAAQFALQTGNTLSLLKIAHEETFSAFSPGSLLLQNVLQQAQQRALHSLSLVTSPAWAERWHPLTEPVWHVTRYNNNSGGLGLRTLGRIKQTARARLRPAA